MALGDLSASAEGTVYLMDFFEVVNMLDGWLIGRVSLEFLKSHDAAIALQTANENISYLLYPCYDWKVLLESFFG